ncbi:MAG: hypothetical protein AAGD25_08355 [Cyanobacteria bacterium P01_F01_bin.150]
MVNSSSNRQRQLAQWLQQLVKVLELQEGSTWRTLVATVSGKSAVIKLDDTLLQLQASAEYPFQVIIDYPPESAPVNFCSDAETLRDIIAGQLIVDQAITMGRIYLRGDLKDLLGMHKLLMEILADGPLNPHLQALWEEFDQHWLPASASTAYSYLQQRPIYGEFIHHIPKDVL